VFWDSVLGNLEPIAFFGILNGLQKERGTKRRRPNKNILKNIKSKDAKRKSRKLAVMKKNATKETRIEINKQVRQAKNKTKNQGKERRNKT